MTAADAPRSSWRATPRRQPAPLERRSRSQEPEHPEGRAVTRPGGPPPPRPGGPPGGPPCPGTACAAVAALMHSQRAIVSNLIVASPEVFPIGNRSNRAAEELTIAANAPRDLRRTKRFQWSGRPDRRSRPQEPAQRTPHNQSHKPAPAQPCPHTNTLRSLPIQFRLPDYPQQAPDSRHTYNHNGCRCVKRFLFYSCRCTGERTPNSDSSSAGHRRFPCGELRWRRTRLVAKAAAPAGRPSSSSGVERRRRVLSMSGAAGDAGHCPGSGTYKFSSGPSGTMPVGLIRKWLS